MIKKSIYIYFWFGTCVRFLQDAPAGVPLSTPQDNGSILYNLRRLFNELDVLQLQVTIRASHGLREIHKRLLKKGSKHKLTEDEADELREGVGILRNTLEAEIEGFDAYIVTPKRVDVIRLINNVGGLFPPGLYEKMPELVKFDLAEAGKCIAFERPTAAAFHLMRATEGVLRDFYCAIVRQKRGSMLWGPVVTDLRGRKKAQKHHVLLNHLDHIRASFRNPTQHPEKVYDIQEAQELWSLCVDVIARMVPTCGY